MTAAFAITRATTRQILGVRRGVVFLLLELALGGVYLISSTALTEASALDWVLGISMTMFFPVLVPIVALIVSAGSLGSEKRDSTLSFIMLRPIPRSLIATSKLLAAVVVAGGLNAVGATGLGVAHGIATGSWNLLAPLIVGAIVASAIYAALFVPLGLLTDRAVLVGLLLVFIFENGVVSALPGLATLSPWRFGVSAFAGMSSVAADHEVVDGALGNLTPGAGGALVAAVVMCVLSVLVLTLLLRRRDLA
jgi:ABC-2 type transport system permease protein